MKTLFPAITLLVAISLLSGCSKSSDNDTSKTEEKSGASSKSNGAALESKVKSALAGDSSLQGASIQVDASEAPLITLRGTAKSDAQIDRAKELAMKADPSIQAVLSKIKIQ